MLILPPGHWQQTARVPRFGRRERWIVGSGVALLATLAVVLVIAFTSLQRTSHRGCIDVSAATVIGGSELYRCGAAARALCAQPEGAGTAFLSFQRALAQACRKAGLPVPFRGSQSTNSG